MAEWLAAGPRPDKGSPDMPNLTDIDGQTALALCDLLILARKDRTAELATALRASARFGPSDQSGAPVTAANINGPMDQTLAIRHTLVAEVFQKIIDISAPVHRH
jgi:hypothetical protein